MRNLVVSTTGTPPSSLRQSITGTLDGAPVTIADGDEESPALTDDFEQRAEAALGVELYGSVVVRARFTHTGPPG